MWPYIILGGGAAVLLLAAAGSSAGPGSAPAPPRPPPRRLRDAATPLPSLGVPTYASSPYGYRVHPVDHAWRLHKGIDLPAPQGTPVMAPVDGVVVYAQPWDGESHGGTVVAFDGKGEAEGLRFKFMHLSAIPIPVGTPVSKGGLVALSGNTGKWTTGPHLHMEVEDKASGAEYDPVDVFPPGTFTLTRGAKVSGVQTKSGLSSAGVVMPRPRTGDLWEPPGDPEGLLDTDPDLEAEQAQIQSIYGIGPEEAAAIVEVADGVGGRGLHLARVIYAESRMNPKAVNPSSGATGLIQWIPSSAQKLGTTVEAIRRMSFLKQMELVDRYLLSVAAGSWAGGGPGLLDTQFKMGAAVFYPAWRDRSPSSVLPSKVQAANPGIRTMGDYMDRALSASARREARAAAAADAVVDADDAQTGDTGADAAAGAAARAVLKAPAVQELLRRGAALGEGKLRALSLRDGLVLGSTVVAAHVAGAILVAENPALRTKVGAAFGLLNNRPIPVPGLPWLKVHASFDRANPGAGIRVDLKPRRRT